MLHLLRSKGITRELVHASFNHPKVILAREHPEVGLAVADATIALAHRLDLRGVHLEDERTAVAVATVRLARLLGVDHCGLASQYSR